MTLKKGQKKLQMKTFRERCSLLTRLAHWRLGDFRKRSKQTRMKTFRENCSLLKRVAHWRLGDCKKRDKSCPKEIGRDSQGEGLLSEGRPSFWLCLQIWSILAWCVWARMKCINSYCSTTFHHYDTTLQQHTATHCNALQRMRRTIHLLLWNTSPLHYDTTLQQHTATYCNTLQRMMRINHLLLYNTAPPYYDTTLQQHTTTHCNTQQYTSFSFFLHATHYKLTAHIKQTTTSGSHRKTCVHHNRKTRIRLNKWLLNKWL